MDEQERKKLFTEHSALIALGYEDFASSNPRKSVNEIIDDLDPAFTAHRTDAAIINAYNIGYAQAERERGGV